MTDALFRRFGKTATAMLTGVFMALFVAAAVEAGTPGPLKIGLLIDLSRGSPEVHEGRKRGFDLAISHINKAGGVFGHPVATAVGDTEANPETAVTQARRLVEEEGVHAIVGPGTSASALAVAAQVTGPAGIPTVSNSATSPKLSTAEDGDFLFRTTYSDIRQGPVLARVARERGFDKVGLLYRDDAWGQGLAGAFAAAWEGGLVSVATGSGQTEFLDGLRESASEGAEALVVIAFETEAERIVRQALDSGLYDRFVFGDAAKRLSLVRAIGGARLGGMYGTGPGDPGDTPSGAAWEAAYVAEYGALPTATYVREAYDATVALALAAQAAGSVEGAEIRDRLREIGAPPGATAIAGAEGIADALGVLRQGGEIDYNGAASDMDWDENGDLRRGRLGIWRFTGDERIEEVETVVYSR